MSRLVNWDVFYLYGYDETLRNLMKMEYTHEDGDEFVDYSWERALSIKEDVYQEWLCGEEHVLTLLEFMVLLGLYEQRELKDQVFPIHFNNLEISDKGFDHDSYWRKIGEPTKTHRRTSLVKDALMRIVHRILTGNFVHRTGSRQRCQQLDLWLMSLMKDEHFVNVAWFIAEYLHKGAPRIRRFSDICGGHYVTKLVRSLGYLVNGEINKCSKPIECKEWTTKNFTREFDMENMSLKQPVLLREPIQVGNEQRDEPSGLNSIWGDYKSSLNEIERKEVWRDSMLIRNNYMLEHSMPILHHLVDLANYTYLTYEPPNVPPYPYPYVSYPYPYTHYPDTSNQYHSGGYQGAPRDDYIFTGAMPGYGGNSIIPSLGYEKGGSSRRVHDDDDEMND
ncbi:hypothetical protein Tco_0669887 [Tanacetum coccineum]